MKYYVHGLLKLMGSACFLLPAIIAPPGAPAQDAVPADSKTTSEVEITPYAPVAWTPHSRVWQRVTARNNPDGSTDYRTNAYTELATGLCVQDRNGVWRETSEQIQITPTGGQATNGNHQVFFSGNINDGVDLTMPDGQRLVSHVLGISLFDGTKSVLIASLTNAQGQLLPSQNQVQYDGCFSDINCSLRYTYTKAGLSQFLIFNENPATIPPEAYGLNPATTKIQLLTEFINPPMPEITQAVTDSGATEDCVIAFASMQMRQGKAFLLGDSSAPVVVRKHWQTIENRVFLVEEIDYQSVAAQLQTLPPAAAPSGDPQNPPPGGILHKVSPKRLLPPPMLARKSSQGLRLARTSPKAQGYVLDYTVLLASQTNFVFQSDSTFYVSDYVQLIGTTVFEGGSIIKFTNSPTATLYLTYSTNAMTWKNSNYRPVVFTSKNDNSCGDAIGNSTGNPTNFYAITALDLTELSNPAVSNVRFSYLSNAIGAVGITLSDAQFNQCYSIFNPSSETFYLRNVLAYQVGGLQTVSCSCAATVTVENATFHFCTNFLNAYSGTTVALTNCLFVCVTNWNTGTVSTNSSAFLNSDAGIFQQVGGASHYLAPDSPYLAAGTTNHLNAALIQDLQQKSTWPPVVFAAGNYTNNMTLYPRAPRNTNSSPDIGYRYDPLDYVFTGAVLTNASLTLLGGVAIGTYGNWGIEVANGGSLNSTGGVSAVNRIVHYNTVQEQATTNWTDNTLNRYGVTTLTNNACEFHLTDWSVLGVDGYTYFDGNPSVGAASPQAVTFRDSYFHGGNFSSRQAQINATNCLFERVHLNFSFTHLTAVVNFMNNEFYGGNLGADTTTTCTNNFFDQTTLSGGAGDYNGYLTGASRISPNGTHDKILSSITYQAGPLGNYYQATTSGLANFGSTTADNLGLYHYTCTTNQVKETNSTVDLGLHYVAVANGVPISSSGDGIGDFLKDSNGNGVYDSTIDLGNWLTNSTAGDGISDYLKYIEGRNLKVAGSNVDTNWIVNLKVYTPLK